MDLVTFAPSLKEEGDSAAEERWESDGGHPAQREQLACDVRTEDARIVYPGRTIKASPLKF